MELFSIRIQRTFQLVSTKKVFSDKNNYLCTQGKQLLYYESYRGRLVFV